LTLDQRFNSLEVTITTVSFAENSCCSYFTATLCFH